MPLRGCGKMWGGLWQLEESPGLACSHRCFLCALVKAASMSVKAASMSVLVGPGITELLECGTTEAGLGADAAARDNMKMLQERGTHGGSV